MHEIAALVMRSRLHALSAAGLFGALSLLFLPAAFLSAAILALVVLRRGVAGGLTVALGAACLVAAGWWLVDLRPGLGFPVVFMLWLPVFVGGGVLRNSRSLGIALLSVAVVCVAWVIVMHMVTGDVVAFWRGWLARAVAGVPGATLQGFERDGTLPLMNGLAAFTLGFFATLSLLLGRWMQSLLYYPGGFGEEFRGLRLSWRLTVAVALSLAVASALDRVLLSDLFLVSLMLYLFVGLAVIHGIVDKRRLSWVWAAPPYVAMVLMPQYATLGLALLGAADGFARFRTRVADLP